MRWRLCWRLLVPTLRLELVTVVPAVLSSIAERHLGDTLLPAVTAEEEVSTVLLCSYNNYRDFTVGQHNVLTKYFV